VRLYLALLIASQVVQFARSRPVEPAADQSAVETATYDDAGRVSDRRVLIAYREWGDASSEQTILMLHGNPGNGSSFRHLAEQLAPHMRVLAPDLPGFGQSSGFVPDYSIEAHARYALAFMDELGIERTHVLGFSMGSGPAFHMAAMAPDRVQSILAFGGIGIQEGEGSGDYHFEHLKYAILYAGSVVLPEAIPHFGLLGSRSARLGVARNFWDTDQRPIRSILESLQTPSLILHGKDDFLVPAWVAEEHHRLLQNSALTLFDGGHFMLFFPEQAERVAGEIIPFVQAVADPETEIPTEVHDYSTARAEASLPVEIDVSERGNPWMHMALIAGATFISEDLTCIAVGLLIHRHELDIFVGILGCFIGIFLGDLGLWLAGRLLGRPLLRWKRVARYLPTDHLDRWGDWFDRHGWTAVIASRCLPGTRLPTFIGAGIVGHNGGRFVLWALLAGLIWTPLLVILAAIFGPVVAGPIERLLGAGWLSLIVALITLFILIRTFLLTLTFEGRARLAARLSRFWRREFWPGWLTYLPLVPWLTWLAIRYKGPMTLTAANPGIPAGGIVGESKSHILDSLEGQEKWIIPYALIRRGRKPVKRTRVLREIMTRNGWEFPIILKPDASQRGVGLRLINDEESALEYFASTAAPIVAQVYHPGPHEAGVFYYRLPGQEKGQIFSITDKAFPIIVGDGRRTLRQLIYRHPRYRMQAKVFLSRHVNAADRVLDRGEPFRLGVAGNHCQGAAFFDGSHLITPELEERVEGIARSFPGFDFGRFDVRYSDEEKFKRGEEFAIVELNGALSESTNIYDPKFSVLRAYRVLFEQWAILYRIGAEHRRRGRRTTSIRDVIRTIARHYRARTVSVVSD
jgi:pimeloyl-ACP methyl ester carboxylesterase/membrane protein DedA with SNARE-associated domain